MIFSGQFGAVGADQRDQFAGVLSPHEFTTLMLVKDAPDQIEADRAELHTLLEHQLVTFELLASGHRQPRITPQGHAVLKAVARIR